MPIKRLLLTTTLISFSSTIFASPFAIYDARSAGMGGTGVASAHISSAPFYNPAMLAAQRDEEDFSLLFGGGINARDNDKLLDDIDAFNAAGSAAAYEAAIDNAVGKSLSLQVNGFLALGFAGETWSMAGSKNTYLQANIGTTKRGAQGISSTVEFTGVEVVETGFSLARKFGDFSVGITPKSQNVTSYYASQAISSNDDLSNIIDTGTSTGKTSHGTSTNLDVGAVYKVTENWKVGAVLRNALSEDYDTGSNTITLKPQTRVGVAYTGDIITLSADYDLGKNDPIIPGGEKTQFLNTGVELDLLDFFQLRAGVSKNTADSAADATFSVGFGFTLLAAQLDFAAAGNDNNVSALVQLGVRW